MPRLFPMLELLLNWNPDNAQIPPRVYDTVERLDYQKKEDYDRAKLLEHLEIPFVVHNIPNIDDVVRKWKDDDYLIAGLPTRPLPVQRSHNNHFMFYTASSMHEELRSKLRPGGGYRNETEAQQAYRPPGYTAKIPPPVPDPMTFAEYIKATKDIEAKHPNNGNESYPHLYLTIADTPESFKTIISKDISIWRRDSPSLFVRDAEHIRGIHCRIGMRGVVAESHWDGHLNFIAMLRGTKRYILSPPRSCQHMDIMSEGPSRRHAATDFSDWHVLHSEESAGQLVQAEALEVLLGAGDVLYLPSFWLHYIISLNQTFQCNARSGVSPVFDTDVDALNRCEAGASPPPVTAEHRAKAHELWKKFPQRQ